MISEENRKVFEQAGRRGVIKMLEGGVCSRERAEQAYEWLDEKTQERQTALILEQTRLARSATRAAWIAAIVAVIAAILAALAIPPVLAWISGLTSFLFSR